eukprot:COSAG04_NODE_459_length_14010_cov_5.397311_2_plen_60_part_00
MGCCSRNWYWKIRMSTVSSTLCAGQLITAIVFTPGHFFFALPNSMLIPGAVDAGSSSGP